MPSINCTAHKHSGVCSVCGRVCKLLPKDGTVHKHGFGANSKACPGSYHPPLTGSTNIHTYHSQTANSQAAAATQPQFSPIASGQATICQDSPIVCDIPFDHPQLQTPLIKVIPKSSRASCGQILSRILSGIAADSTRIHRWNDLLMFGSKLLAKPARGGKNHNLENLMNKRSVAYNDPAYPA